MNISSSRPDPCKCCVYKWENPFGDSCMNHDCARRHPVYPPFVHTSCSGVCSNHLTEKPQNDTFVENDQLHTKEEKDVSIVGLMYTDRELIGFGDRKSTVTINGQDREEPGYCGVKKVFVGENFIVVAYNSNVIVRGMEIKRVSDVLERYTHVSSVDQYIGNVYRAFQEWCVGGTISLIIGDNKCVPYICRYRVRCVDITNGSMMETVYYKNCCEGVYGGATDFRKMLDQHDEVFKQGDEIGLRNLIVRKVEDDERAGNYCPVGKEIDFKRIDLIDG